MNEIKGNIWDSNDDWICITTNGILKSDKRAVMGKGLALDAKNRVKDCDLCLGKLIDKYGNHVHIFSDCCPYFVSFPTKHHWKERSDVKLIERSCQELLELWKKHNKPTVALSRVGCLNGGLNWKDVYPILNQYFDTDETRKYFTIFHT
jgi:hypothetical protein